MHNIITLAGKFLDVAGHNRLYHDSLNNTVMYFGLRSLDDATELLKHASALYAIPNGCDISNTAINHGVTEDFTFVFIDAHGGGDVLSTGGDVAGQLELQLFSRVRLAIEKHKAFVMVRCENVDCGSYLVKFFDELEYDCYYIHGVEDNGDKTSVWLFGICRELGVGKLKDDAHTTGHPLDYAKQPELILIGDVPKLTFTADLDTGDITQDLGLSVTLPGPTDRVN